MFDTADITFCSGNCVNNDCFRNMAHVPIDGTPFSSADLVGSDACPWSARLQKVSRYIDRVYCDSKCTNEVCPRHISHRPAGKIIQIKKLRRTKMCMRNWKDDDLGLWPCRVDRSERDD